MLFQWQFKYSTEILLENVGLERKEKEMVAIMRLVSFIKIFSTFKVIILIRWLEIHEEERNNI